MEPHVHRIKTLLLCRTDRLRFS